MTVKHLTYLSLPPAQRSAAASLVRGRIKSMLANPWLTPSQTELLRKELEKVGQWEKGELHATKEKDV